MKEKGKKKKGWKTDRERKFCGEKILHPLKIMHLIHMLYNMICKWISKEKFETSFYIYIYTITKFSVWWWTVFRVYINHIRSHLPNGIASVEPRRGRGSRRVPLMYQQPGVGQAGPMRAQRLHAVRLAQPHPWKTSNQSNSFFDFKPSQPTFLKLYRRMTFSII